jgi:uncharacterized membrane protein YheB (UPF0754 family)
MEIILIFITPVLGAAIGFFTNLLAIIMLFRPHRQKKIGGFVLPFTPGLIPKEKASLARKIGEVLGETVLTKDALADAVTNSGIPAELLEKVRGFAGESIPRAPEFIKMILEHPEWEKFLRQIVAKLIKENTSSFVGIFLNPDKIYDSLSKNLMENLKSEEGQKVMQEYLDKAIDRVLESPLNISFLVEKAGEYIAGAIDIPRIAEDKINQMDSARIEYLVLSVVRKQLTWIAALGGVLGFIIGFVPGLINLFAG